MKHLLIVLLVTCSSLCILFVGSFSNTSASNPVPALERRFARHFYQRLSLGSGGGNLLVVPLAVHVTLTVLLQGAHGADRNQLMQILGTDHLTVTHFDQINPSYQDILKNNNGYYQMPIRFFLDKKYTVNQEFVKTAKDYFGIETENINLSNKETSAKTINDFVMRVSNHTIRETVKEDDIDDASGLISVSSFHMKSQWVLPFVLSKTTKQDFHTNEKTKVQVTMMHMSDELHFIWDGTFRAKILALDLNTNLSMVLLLPDDTEGIFELEGRLAHQDVIPLLQLARSTPAVPVEVWLPKFHLVADFYLETTLKQMGIASTFTSDADLSGISCCGDLHVSKIRHKSYLVVGECGIEFPCCIGVGLKNKTEKGPSQEFRADHPFLFFILKDNLILVQGRVVQPKQ